MIWNLEDLFRVVTCPCMTPQLVELIGSLPIYDFFFFFNLNEILATSMTWIFVFSFSIFFLNFWCGIKRRTLETMNKFGNWILILIEELSWRKWGTKTHLKRERTYFKSLSNLPCLGRMQQRINLDADKRRKT